MSITSRNTQGSRGISTGVIAPRTGVLGALELRLDHHRRALRTARRTGARRAMRRAGRQIQALRAAQAVWQAGAEVEQMPRGRTWVVRFSGVDHLVGSAAAPGELRRFFCACPAGGHCPAAHLVAAVEGSGDALAGV
ncbi:MAG TPA: hypothetical protein VFS21_33240 [Roseiflexaceae bacterium]|nr:hypothetical protein [Roseiflexaceae bacterium]